MIIKKHNKVNRNTSDLPLMRNSSLIWKHKRLLDVIILVWNKGIHSAVDGVILAGFDFKRNGGKAFVIIYQIIHLSLASVVVVEQLVTLRGQLACNNTFINGAVVYDSIRASVLRKSIYEPTFSDFSIILQYWITNFSIYYCMKKTTFQ